MTSARPTFYVATGFLNRDAYWRTVRMAERAGFVNAYAWPNAEDQPDELVAQNEIRAAMTAAVFIVVLPGGLGTHTEFGARLASGCSVLLVPDGAHGYLLRPAGDPAGEPDAPARQPFYRHPQVEVVAAQALETRLRGMFRAVALLP